MTAWITVAIGAFVAAIIAAVLWLRSIAAGIAGEEIRAWLPHLSKRKIKRAAMALPPTQRDILEAWEADLDEYKDRPVAMFLIATRIARDAKLIAREAQEIALESSLAPGREHTRRLRLPTATAGRLVKTFGTVTGWIRNTTARRPQRQLLRAVAQLIGTPLNSLFQIIGFLGGLITAVVLGVDLIQQLSLSLFGSLALLGIANVCVFALAWLVRRIFR